MNTEKKIETPEEQATRVGKDWLNSPYYDDAERWTFVFWNEAGLFRQLFDKLDLTNVVELACGHGRHAEMFKLDAGHVTLLDILDDNVEFCKKRHANAKNISCIRNNGVDFRPLDDSTVTAIFCYDAMVHFPSDVVRAYIADASRVLKVGARALFHHSNYGVMFQGSYGNNPHARNYMTQELFCAFARDNGFEVETSRIIPWGHVPDLDCVTLLLKT